MEVVEFGRLSGVQSFKSVPLKVLEIPYLKRSRQGHILIPILPTTVTNMSAIDVFIIISAIVLATLLLRTFFFKSNCSLPYPPGPKGLPLVGNVFDIMKPDVLQQKVYAKWGRDFGW